MESRRFLWLSLPALIIAGRVPVASGDTRVSGTVELLGGAVYNLPVPVVIRQGR